MALVSKMVGEEKKWSNASDVDSTEPHSVDAGQYKSLFRLGHTARETLALIDAGAQPEQSNLATVDPRQFTQNYALQNLSNHPSGVTSHEKMSISTQELEELVNSDADNKNLVTAQEDAPIEFAQTDTGVSTEAGTSHSEGLPNFFDDEQTSQWIAQAESSEKESPLHQDSQTAQADLKPDAETNFLDDVLAQLNEHLETLMVFVGGMQIASGGDFLGAVGKGLSVAGVSPSNTITGAVIDGYVGGATVFADINLNGIQDAWEPFAITDSNGAYRFDTSLDLSNAPIISVGGVDQYTGASIGYLVAPVGLTYVTPITTLLHYAQTTQTADQLLGTLGITLDDLKKDPIETYQTGDAAAVAKAEAILKTGASILTTVSGVSALVSGLSGQSIQEANKTVFAKIVGNIQTGQLQDEAFIGSVISDSLPAGTTANAALVSGAASAMSQLLTKLSGSSLQDSWAYASIGQSILSKEILDLSKNNLTDESIVAWKNEIKLSYEKKLTDLAEYQKTIVSQKINSAKVDFKLNADEIKISLGSGADSQKTIKPLDNDSIFIEGQKLKLLSIQAISKVLPTGLTVMVDSTSNTINLNAINVDKTKINSYGDFYYKYTAALDGNPNQIAEGVFKIQVVPQAADFQFQASASNGSILESDTATTTKIQLNKVISLSSVGPGDTLILDGLPKGTVIKAGDGWSDIQSEGVPLTIPSDKLLMFDNLVLEMDGNLSGTFDLKATLASRYGSAVGTQSEVGSLKLTATVDGLNSNSPKFQEAIRGQLESKINAGEDQVFGLINDDATKTRLIQLLNDRANYLVDTDGSEAIKISIGIPHSWVVSDRQGVITPSSPTDANSAENWYQIQAENPDELISRLAELKVLPETDYNGEFTINARIDSYEISNASQIKASNEFVLIKSNILPQAEQLHFKSEATVITAVQRNQVSDPGIDLNVASVFEKKNWSSFKNLTEDFVSLTVKVPVNYEIRLDNSSDNWYLDQVLSTGEKLYKLDGIKLSQLYGNELQSLKIMPAVGISTDPAGATIQISAQTYTVGSAIDLDVTDSTTDYSYKNIQTIVKPELLINSKIAPTSNVISLKEAQTPVNTQLEWESIKKWNPLLQSSALKAGQSNWVYISDVNNALEFSIIKNGEIKVLTSQDGTYKLSANDYSDLYIKSKQYLSTDFSLKLQTSIEQIWGDGTVIQTKSDWLTVTGQIQAVPSGVSSFNLYQPTQWYEGQLVKINEFFKNANGQISLPKLKDATGEQIFYELKISKEITVTVDGQIKSGILDSSGLRTYTLTESELMSATMSADKYISKNDFLNANIDTSISIQAYSKENGLKSLSEVKSTVFDILPVSNQPKLEVTKDKISQLLSGDERVSLPVFVRSTDIGEALDAKIYIKNAPLSWVKADGSVDSPIKFYLGDTGQSLAIQYSQTKGLYVTIDKSQISMLPSLQIASSQDLRNEHIVLSVEAGSTDAGAQRVSIAQDVSFEIFKPVHAPEIIVEKIQSDLASSDLTLKLQLPTEQQSDIDAKDVSILVIGVPDGDYFLNKAGLAIGANLGNQIWVLKAADVFGDVVLRNDSSILKADIKLVGENRQGELAFKTMVTDHTSGSSSAATHLTRIPLVDPVIIDFDGNHQLIHVDAGLAVDLNPYSIGAEVVHNWFSGEVIGNKPTGIGVFIKSTENIDTPQIASYSNLFASIDELNSYKPENIKLWFNANSDQYIDANEIYSANLSDYYSIIDYSDSTLGEIVSDTFTLTPSRYITSSGEPVGTVYSANLTMQNHVEACRVKLTNVSGKYADTPNTYCIDEDSTYTQSEYGASGVAYAFKIKYEVDATDVDGSHFVKIYGVPTGSLLTKGTLVQLDGTPSFWLIEISGNEEIDVAIKSLAPNFSGQINLSADSITSYITDTGSTIRWEGMTDVHTINVLPIVDTPVFPALADSDLQIIEGGELDLSTVGIHAYSPDSAENIIYKLTGIPDQATVRLNGDTVVDWSNTFFKQDEIDSLKIDFPDFYKKTGTIKILAFSQYNNDQRSAAIEQTINYHFSSKADGVLTQSVDSNQFIHEGDSIEIHSSARPNDSDEKIIYEYLVGGSKEAAASVINATDQIDFNGKEYKVFHINAYSTKLIEGQYQSDSEVQLDRFYDGNIEIIQRSASYDPQSGEVSGFVVSEPEVLQVLPIAGGGNSYKLTYLQNNVPVEKLTLKEGVVNDFQIKVTAYDPNEIFTLTSSASTQLISIASQDKTVNALGLNEYSFDVKVNPSPTGNRLSDLKLGILEDSAINDIQLDVEYGILKGAIKPTLENTDSIRLFKNDQNLIALFDSLNQSPSIKMKDSGDDVVSYTLSNVPSSVKITDSKLIAKSKDSRFFSYSIDSNQLASVKLTLLAAAALSNDAIAMTWNVVNTESTTGEQAISDGQNIYLADKISAVTIGNINSANELLVSDNSTLSYKFSGGLNDEYISVKSYIDKGVPASYTLIHADTIQMSATTDNEILHLHVNSFADQLTDFFTTKNVQIQWETTNYGFDSGVLNTAVRLLPNPASWSDSLGVTQAKALFNGGYFAESHVAKNDFVFLDPEYEVAVTNNEQAFTDPLKTMDAVNIFGTNGNDLIIASDQSSILFGADGFNELHGSSFNDILIAGNKTDLLYGGKGSDIFQIALDLEAESTSRDQMDSVLANCLSLNQEQSSALSNQIQLLHQSSGDSIWSNNTNANYHFNAIIGDYSRSIGNEDRLAFTHGNDSTEVSSLIIKGETWGGHTDLIYTFAKDFANSGSGHELSDITAVLMIPDSTLDIQLLDMHNNGISKT